MNATLKNHLVIRKPAINDIRKRPKIDLSLILGVTMIAVFLILFAFEFSRIVKLASTVDYTHSAQTVELASVSR